MDLTTNKRQEKGKKRGLLNVTILTDEPESWIYREFLNAFEGLEKDDGIAIGEADKRDFIDNQIDSLEELLKQSQGSELRWIVDNYLVNFDYYEAVKEWIKGVKAGNQKDTNNTL
jgi:hypothetical protein